MGIDIYAKWRGQEKEEEQRQYTGFSTVSGNVGYLREAYHGGPYVTKYLLKEAFDSKTNEAKIPFSVLTERLPKAVCMAIFRNEKLYGKSKPNPASMTFDGLKASLDNIFKVEMKDDSAEGIAEKIDAKTIEHMKSMIAGGLLPDYAQSFVDFVELCGKKESELGEPVTIYASY